MLVKATVGDIVWCAWRTKCLFVVIAPHGTDGKFGFWLGRDGRIVRDVNELSDGEHLIESLFE